MATDQAASRTQRKKERCLCGKWWAYVVDESTLQLRCKLCKRDMEVRAVVDDKGKPVLETRYL